MYYYGKPTPSCCWGCRYRRPASSALPGETLCHYMLDTGISRDSSVEQCLRWRPAPARPNAQERSEA